jgi:tetratricopeptide (TPR) repeat protein
MAVATRLSMDVDVSARFRLQSWGDFTLFDVETGEDVRPRGRKARALIAYLAMHPDRSVSRERLMALFWSDRGEEQARGSLRQTLFELKPFGNGAGLLAIERECVTLHRHAIETDIDQLRTRIARQDFAGLLDALPDALERPFANLDCLDDGFDEWLQIERTRMRDELVQLIADGSALALAASDIPSARALHARLQAFDPDHGQPAPPPSPRPAFALASRNVASRPGLTSRRGVLAAALAVPVVAGAAAIGTWWAPLSGSSDTPLHREAAGLTESAKAMLRERDTANVRAAAGLLRRAVSLAPDYAPAWAALAIAIATGETGAPQLAEAEAHARKAISLDPDLADGHAALGMILGFVGEEAGTHLKRAAALNPRDPQTQYWLANHYMGELDFQRSLAAFRASVTGDPLWSRGVNNAALLAWQMGHPEEARRYARRLVQLDPQEAFACEYQLDMADGQFATIARRMIGSRARFNRPAHGDRKLGATLLILGHKEPARLLLRLEPYQWQIASGKTPSPDAFRSVDEGAVHDWFDSNYFLALALQRLLFAGRGEEIVAAHERVGSGQMAQLARPDVTPFGLVQFGPELGLAYKSLGRERDAARVLDRVERVVRDAFAQGSVPIPFNVCAARLWAARGERDRALALLTHAVDRGFHYAPVTPMPDLSDIFAFKTLRDEPRFETLRGRLKSHLEAERQRLGPVFV